MCDKSYSFTHPRAFVGETVLSEAVSGLIVLYWENIVYVKINPPNSHGMDL